MNLYYQSSGEGHPLIIVHGLFGSADNWRSLAKYFSKFCQVISVDLRNHGRSPHDEEMNFTAMAEDIERLRQHLNLAKVHLIGHSLGGKVAMKYAELYADNLQKLIVVDISPRAYQGEHTPLMDAMLALNLSSYDSRTEVDNALAASIEDKMVRAFLLMNLVAEQGQLKWRINLPALKKNYREYMRAVFDNAQQFEKPCLFIYGEHSDYVTAADRQAIRYHFPQVQFAAIPAGHWVHSERPQQFKHVVENFLND